MALGTIGAALATSALNAGAGLLSSKLSKKGKGGLSGFAPSGFSAGGLNATFDQSGNVRVGADSGRTGLTNSLASLFPQQANLTAGLRGLVSPGIGALTQSRLAGLGDSRTRAIGDLRENLQRRRVLGSSFGQDALARAEAEFAREEDRVRAESFLQELDLTNKLINQEFETRRGEFSTQLNELNLQAEIAGKLASGASSILASNAQLKERLLAQEAQASGSFFGQAFQPVIDAFAGRLGQASLGSQLANSTSVRFA